MPWCHACDRFYNPNSLLPDGTCRVCGTTVAADEEPDAEETSTRAPWHFKALVAVTAAYLGWRALQGIFWVSQNL